MKPGRSSGGMCDWLPFFSPPSAGRTRCPTGPSFSMRRFCAVADISPFATGPPVRPSCVRLRPAFALRLGPRWSPVRRLGGRSVHPPIRAAAAFIGTRRSAGLIRLCETTTPYSDRRAESPHRALQAVVVPLRTPTSTAPISPSPYSAPRALSSAAVGDRKSTRLNSSHIQKSRMPSSA